MINDFYQKLDYINRNHVTNDSENSKIFYKKLNEYYSKEENKNIYLKHEAIRNNPNINEFIEEKYFDINRKKLDIEEYLSQKISLNNDKDNPFSNNLLNDLYIPQENQTYQKKDFVDLENLPNLSKIDNCYRVNEKNFKFFIKPEDQSKPNNQQARARLNTKIQDIKFSNSLNFSNYKTTQFFNEFNKNLSKNLDNVELVNFKKQRKLEYIDSLSQMITKYKL